MHLAIDLGTSSVKLLAARPDGTIVGEREQSLAVDEPRPGWAEADPEAWWTAVERGLRALDGVWMRIAVTGQMHGTVLVDDDGAPVRPAVLWPDVRAADQRGIWNSLPGRTHLGGPFSPGMTGPVLAWLARHEPDALGAASRVLLPKDFLRGRLTGSYDLTDRSDAAGTLLWDIPAERWSPSLPDAAGFAPDLLPNVVRSDAVVGRAGAAEVMTGGGDTAVSLLAVERTVGGWLPGDRVVNVGSGAQVIDPVVSVPVLVPGDRVEPGWHTYADCLDGHYAMVAIVNAGVAVAAARHTLGLDWDAYRDLVTSSPPGADGCVFVPALGSERGAMRPRGDIGADEAHWHGPDDPTSRARAVAESQAFLVRRADTLLGPSAGRVFVVGGGARDDWVVRLLADVLHRDVVRLDVRSAAALGALCLTAGPDFAVRARAVAYRAEPSAAFDEAYERWWAACYG